MARFFATLLLLVLLVESAPWVLLQSGGCSMPCCKRSGGKGACCPRPSAVLRQQGAGSETCRMVACDAAARESTSIQSHLPAILDVPVGIAYSPLTARCYDPDAALASQLAEDPPTPPPRFLQA